MWQGEAPGPFDKAADQAANAQIASLRDNVCKPN